MKKIISLLSLLTLLSVTSVKAEMSYGIGFMAGKLSASGTETEGTESDSSDREKSFDEVFAGADVFVETELSNGYTVGLSYVPVDVEIGSGERVDSSAGADVASEADTGTRTAKAELTDLLTLYTNIPFGNEGEYALAGLHYTKVKTAETLPNSSYGDENIYGAQLGVGSKRGNKKFEIFYSKFEDIEISSTGGNSNSIKADADALTVRYSIGF